MPLNPDEFRRAMGALAAGVCVVTVRDAAGVATGMTATSVTSLSLVPPLILVCVGHEAAMHDAIVTAPWFGVVMLSAAQQNLAERFAAKGRQPFNAADRTTPAGLPVIPGALAVLDCRRTAVLEGGDHAIVVGMLEWAEARAGEPLLHYRGRYTRAPA